MSGLGHSRRFCDVRGVSGLPPTADISGHGRHFAFVPKADLSLVIEPGALARRGRAGGLCRGAQGAHQSPPQLDEAVGVTAERGCPASAGLPRCLGPIEHARCLPQSDEHRPPTKGIGSARPGI
jgi:hypothetical protein